MTVLQIRDYLCSFADVRMAGFTSKLVPGIEQDFLGIKTPVLREFAKDIYRSDSYSEFLRDTPHVFFEENQLHAFIISLIPDFSACVAEVERFLPFVNNWATCDQMIPRCFKKKRELLLPYAERWMQSGRTYSVRFGIKCLMDYFLDDAFFDEILAKVAKIRSSEYYVNMMISWFFATALAKQWAAAFPYVRDRCLDDWCMKKTVQKAVESFRVPAEHKRELRAVLEV